MKFSEKNKQIFSFVIILIIIGFVTWMLIILSKATFMAFTQLNPTVAAGIIASGATVFVSIISVLYSKHIEQKINIKKEHREKKIPVYEELLKFIFRVAFAQKEGSEQLLDKEIIDTFSDLTQKVIIWASDDVVKSFHKFRVVSIASITEKNGFLSVALSVEELFLSIRRDLGHKNKGIYPGQLLKMFVNDIDEFIKLVPK